MKLSPRNAALVLGVVALIGFIPDTLNAQASRSENITISARSDNEHAIVLPTVPVSPPTPSSPGSTVTENDQRDQRASALDRAASPRPYESIDFYIHLPPDAAKNQPLRVLLVLHGMGAGGSSFSQGLVADADKNHWLIVAPTIPYANWMDPTTMLQDDVQYTGVLADMMNDLPKKLGLKLRSHALVYGFSRGAQLAHRFAFFYPERVESVAAISAGTFTLPDEHKNNDTAAPLLQLPYGVGDLGKYIGHPLNHDELKKISFLLEVGGNDTAPGDVPRQFDPYGGKNRVERARAFLSALLINGIQARLIVFPGAGHEVTNEMRIDAIRFLRDEELAKKAND